MKNDVSLLQVMFENYEFDGVYIAIQAVLTLYAQGQLLECLYDFLHVTEMIELKGYNHFIYVSMDFAEHSCFSN